MAKCIFCKGTDGLAQFRTREHIVPESLGGGDWSELRLRVVCDQCQNYFGAKVEREVLGDYPFNHIRTFAGVPTKKRRMPFFDDRFEGQLRALPDGQLQYVPAPHFAEALYAGKKTVMRLLAEPRSPARTCQFLLKMGLELLAEKDASPVFDEAFDPARRVARYLDAKYCWFYFHIQNPLLRSEASLLGVHQDPDTFIEVSLVEHDGGPMVNFEILEHTFFAPLTNNYVLAEPSAYADLGAKIYSVQGPSVKRHDRRSSPP